ncbi:MarR family transcriptional regulator [Streptomyces sp. NPDC005731]|uniref:LexA family protein n=1 Tax=Streptomyces sp. NPDC005731 TaxID=3157056 RepID=UPI0033E43F9F
MPLALVLRCCPSLPDTVRGHTIARESILRCIRESIARRGASPTMQELGKQLGLSSTSSVHYRLRRIEELGYIAREPGRTRGVRLT